MTLYSGVTVTGSGQDPIPPPEDAPRDGVTVHTNVVGSEWSWCWWCLLEILFMDPLQVFKQATPYPIRRICFRIVLTLTTMNTYLQCKIKPRLKMLLHNYIKNKKQKKKTSKSWAVPLSAKINQLPTPIRCTLRGAAPKCALNRPIDLIHEEKSHLWRS